MMTREYNVDGRRTTSLEAFFGEFSDIVLSGVEWGRNLDAFNDVLRGGFGNPDDGFTIHWHGSAAARQSLAYGEIVRQLELRLERCHAANRDMVEHELAVARRGMGPTVFDWLIEIIADHGPGGDQAEDQVLIILD